MGTSRSLRRYSGRRDKKQAEKRQKTSHNIQIAKGSNPQKPKSHLADSNAEERSREETARRWRLRLNTAQSILGIVKELATTVRALAGAALVLALSIDGVLSVISHRAPETAQLIAKLIQSIH